MLTLHVLPECVCVCVCVCTEMAISWKVKQTVECFSSVSCAMALRSRRPGSKGPSCWAHAALPGPPGPYWSLEVKIPPPTHSRIFASQSVPERRIGVMRFLEQLVWMFSLIDSQFLQSFMLCPFSTLNTRIVKVNFKFRLSWACSWHCYLLSLRYYNRLLIFFILIWIIKTH